MTNFTTHHIPYKFGRRLPNIRGAISRHSSGDTINAQALEEILTEVFGAQDEQQRQDWLEIERWEEPPAASAGSTLYDAIIDPILTSADADNHRYPNLTSLIANESWGPTYVFAIGVRFRPGTETVEPASGTVTIPGPMVMESVGPAAASSTAGWTIRQATTDPARSPWDLNGTTFHTTGATSFGYLQIYNAGTARGAMTLDSDVVFLNNCIVEGWTAGGVTKLVSLTGGTTVAWDCTFGGLLFSGRCHFTDCNYEASNTSGTPNWFASNVYWDGGALTGTSPTVTLRILGQFYIRLDRIDTSTVTSATSAATGITYDLRATSEGTLIMWCDGLGQNGNVIVRGGAGDIYLEGKYNAVTVEASTVAGSVRVIDVVAEGIVDVSGPRLIGQVRTASTAGRVICRGAGMNLRCSGTIASTGTFLSLINCDDSVIVAQADGAAGTSQPYNVDAASDRSYVIFAGSRVAAAPGFGAAGVNASATTRVGTEVAGS